MQFELPLGSAPVHAFFFSVLWCELPKVMELYLLHPTWQHLKLIKDESKSFTMHLRHPITNFTDVCEGNN